MPSHSSFFQRLIKEVPKVENNPSPESYSYEYDYYDYYDPQYDYVEKENYAAAVKYNQQRPSFLRRILSKIPILRERQDIITPFFAPILAGIFVAVASFATASSPEGISLCWQKKSYLANFVNCKNQKS